MIIRGNSWAISLRWSANKYLQPLYRLVNTRYLKKVKKKPARGILNEINGIPFKSRIKILVSA